MKKTAIIILNYNNSTDTRNCVESILRYNTADIKIVLVDNASRAEELEALRRVMDDNFTDWQYIDAKATAPTDKLLSYATLIETGDNLGYACGNNVGLKYIEKDDEVDNVLILNSDVLFTEDLLPGLLKLQSELDSCAIISPVLYKKDMTDYDYNCARLHEKVGQIIAGHFLSYVRLLRGKKIQDIYPERYLLINNKQSGGIMEIELPSGSCMLIRKGLFRELGYFDPNTFLFYEENILFSKTRAKGLKNYLSLDQKCIHLGASTIGKQKQSKWLVDKALKSRRYYVENYSGASKPIIWLYLLSEKFYKFTISMSRRLKR